MRTEMSARHGTARGLQHEHEQHKTCVPFMPPVRSARVLSSVNRHCPGQCSYGVPCMVRSTSAHATLQGDPNATASLERALTFTNATQRARFRAIALKRHALELHVTGPVQDGFWVRASAVLAHLAWATEHGLPIGSVSVSYRSPEDTYNDDIGAQLDGFGRYFDPLHGVRDAFRLELGCKIASSAWVQYASYLNEWSSALRQRSSKIAMVASLPLQPRSKFVEIADAFLEEHRRHRAPLLGVHLRGTDKKQCKVPLDRFMPLIRAYLCYAPNAVVFVATDDNRRLKEVQAAISGAGAPSLVWRAGTTRSVGSHNPGVHATEYRRNTTEAFAASKLGEDVMVDTLILSKADFLIGSQSAITEFALYLNPLLLNRSFTFGIHGHPLPRELDMGGVPAMKNQPWASERCSMRTQLRVLCGNAAARLCGTTPVRNSSGPSLAIT